MKQRFCQFVTRLLLMNSVFISVKIRMRLKWTLFASEQKTKNSEKSILLSL